MALRNKLGIEDSAELAREEERISKKRALELFEGGLFGKMEAGSFSSLKAIHKYLFGDIYEFAGELRNENISKGNFRFAPVMYLEAALTDEIDSREVYMKGIDNSYYYEGYITFKTEDLK